MKNEISSARGLRTLQTLNRYERNLEFEIHGFEIFGCGGTHPRSQLRFSNEGETTRLRPCVWPSREPKDMAIARGGHSGVGPQFRPVSIGLQLRSDFSDIFFICIFRSKKKIGSRPWF